MPWTSPEHLAGYSPPGGGRPTAVFALSWAALRLVRAVLTTPLTAHPPGTFADLHTEHA